MDVYKNIQGEINEIFRNFNGTFHVSRMWRVKRYYGNHST